MNRRKEVMRFLHMGCGESLRSSGLSASCGVRKERPARRAVSIGLRKGRKRDEKQR